MSIGTFGIDLTLGTARFKKGVASAELAMKTFSKSASRDVQAMRKTFGPVANDIKRLGLFAAGAAAGGLTALAVSSARNIDSQAKFAARIGTSQAALVGLQLAAGETAGVADSQLNMALQRMTRRVAEASKGMGEAKGAIAELGLDAKALAALDPAEQFREIAGAMQGVEGSGQQLRLAFKLFDSEGAALVNTLRQGPEALKQYEAEARLLGLAVSEFDAAQIEAANDAFARTGKLAQGLGNTIAVEAAPYVRALSQEFINATVEAGGFSDATQRVFNSFAKGAGFAADVLRGLQVVFGGLTLVAEGFGAAVLSATQLAVNGLVEFADWTNRMINTLINGLNSLPQVDIPLLMPLSGTPAIQTFNGMVEQSRIRLAESRAELHRLATEPMPSTAIEEWTERVKVAAREAESALASATGRGGDTGTPGATDQQRSAFGSLEGQLDPLAAEMEAQAKRRQILQEAQNTELIDRARHLELLVQLEKDHAARVGSIVMEGATARERFSAKSAKDQASDVIGFAAKTTQGVASESKAMFNVNKAAAIAQAVMDNYAGFNRTMAAYPYPINIGLAGLSLAAGAAQIKAIASTSFGGGAGGAASGGGGGTTPSLVGQFGQVNGTPIQSQAVNARPVDSGPRTEVIIQGDIFSQDGLRELAEVLKDAEKDGAARTRVVLRGLAA